MTVDYRVELDRFSGPLDLLLFLVRRNELDLIDLPISEITAQFQRYLAALQFLDLEQAGDFVVMASTLLEIKSRQRCRTRRKRKSRRRCWTIHAAA